MYSLPLIDPKKEKSKIVRFLRKTLEEQDKKNVIVAMSGGVDSATCFSLLKETIAPQSIFVAHLYYFKSQLNNFKDLLDSAKVPSKNILELSIRDPVLALEKDLGLVDERNENYKVRLGNIMARTRMIMLYDLAKEHNALVLGTENKSEYYLGYFTRFGDEASDIEPIRHLFKTQVYKLAEYLNVPKHIITQKPTAGLWLGQTDESEFGFSYKEADIVLYLYFERKMTMEEIKKKGFANCKKIIEWSLKNSYKHRVPYAI